MAVEKQGRPWSGRAGLRRYPGDNIFQICVHLCETSAAIVDFQVKRSIHCLDVNFKGGAVAPSLPKSF